MRAFFARGAMVYSVKEAFLTLQGEGRHAGRAAVFCRFSGCNLWTGREEDRARAVCGFCDTDFVGVDGENGGKFANAEELAALLARLWGPARDQRFVVLTGGEPTLQIDEALIAALHGQGFEIAVETNGTLPVPDVDRLDLRFAQGRRAAAPDPGPRAKTGVPAAGGGARSFREASTSRISCCSPWTGRRFCAIGRRRSTIACAIRAGACRCRRTRSSG